jgi:RNA polymerase sigma-70 factor (ECF subfamily)
MGAEKESDLDEKTSLLLRLLAEYGVELHQLFTKITLRDDVAADLLQDLFLRLWKAGNIMEANNPRAYLFQSAMNLAFDWRRRQRHECKGAALNREVVPMSLSPIDDVIRREDLNLVLSAMEELSPSDRELVVLRFLHGSSYEELAGQLCRTPHCVRALCSKAVARLRKLLDPDAER